MKRFAPIPACRTLVQRFGVNLGFLAFMLVFVAGIGISTGYTIHRLRAQAIADHYEMAAMLARGVEEHLTESLDRMDRALANVIDDADDLPRAQMAARLQRAPTTMPALRSLSLLDKEGRVVASSNGTQVGARIETKDFLSAGEKGSAVLRIGLPVEPPRASTSAPVAHQPSITILREVHIGQRTLTLLATVGREEFIGRHNPRMHTGASFEMLRRDGVTLMASEDQPADSATNPTLMALIAEAESGRFEQTPGDGRAVLTAFHASPSYPLVVVTHIRLDDALAEWSAEKNRLLLIATPTLLAVVALTTLLFIHLRRIEAQHAELRQRKEAAEAQLRAVVEASPEAVLVVESNGAISYANRVCERIFGYTQAEAQALDVNALVPAALREQHRDYLAAFAREPHSRPMGSGMKLAALRKDGSEFPAEISLSPMQIGSRFIVIASICDITQRIRDEEILRASEERWKSALEAAEALLLRASLAERHIIDISERTQERIGQELHDDVGQHLTGVAFLSEILFRKLLVAKLPEREDAAAITRLINEAVAKTRTLAQGLYPVELKEAGLRSMVEQLARSVERSYAIECTVQADEDFAADDADVAINLFRIAQEAINNALRHGKATAVRIALRRTAAGSVLEIADNGGGFPNGKAVAGKGGLGMHTMRYRAALIGAELSIVSGGTCGTKVIIVLPCSEVSSEVPHADAVQRPT